MGRAFRFKERSAKFTTELRAGLITFLMVSDHAANLAALLAGRGRDWHCAPRRCRIFWPSTLPSWPRLAAPATHKSSARSVKACGSNRLATGGSGGAIARLIAVGCTRGAAQAEDYELLGAQCLVDPEDEQAQECMALLMRSLITATSASSLISTFFIGYFGNLPLALAPGIGELAEPCRGGVGR